MQPTLKDLMNTVAERTPTKWRFIGIQLNVPLCELDDIQDQVAGRTNSNVHAFQQMLKKWKSLHPHQYSWATIISALEAPSVAEMKLADELRMKYIS